MIAVLLWHHHWGTSHAYYFCIGMFTLLKKNLLLPICLSVCQSVKANYLSLCLSSNLLFPLKY